jgi:hypothetical protein
MHVLSGVLALHVMATSLCFSVAIKCTTPCPGKLGWMLVSYPLLLALPYKLSVVYKHYHTIQATKKYKHYHGRSHTPFKLNPRNTIHYQA